jgi:hypothetical protein
MVMNYTYYIHNNYLSITICLSLILPYIHNLTPAIIAKRSIPTIKDATTFMRNTDIAIITINAIIPIIIYPIVPAMPKQILPWITNTINYRALLEEIRLGW